MVSLFHFSNEWIVLDSTSHISFILLAALPVGATTIKLLKGKYSLNISTNPLTIVVLPVPGPPTIKEIPLVKKLLIATFWISSYFIDKLLSQNSIPSLIEFLSKTNK